MFGLPATEVAGYWHSFLREHKIHHNVEGTRAVHRRSPSPDVGGSSPGFGMNFRTQGFVAQ
jgi:hypothetical protein